MMLRQCALLNAGTESVVCMSQESPGKHIAEHCTSRLLCLNTA